MFRGGFIGFGRMGITHFSILNNHDSVEIIAVCDHSNILLNIINKYIDIKTYSDPYKMVDREQLDFVIISTPTGSHAEVIQAALDQSLHIFVEKPLALIAEEGYKILNSLEGKKIVNQVGYVNRFNEVFMEVKKLLNAGIIGDIKNFSSEMYGPTVLKDPKSNWRGTRKMGGGCLYEFASHCIDLVVYLIGKPEKVAGSIMQSIYSAGVDDLVLSNFIYKDGCSGTIMVNWSDETYRKPTNIIKIFGKKGKIIADKHMYKLFLKEEDQAHGFHQGLNTRYITDFAKSVRIYVRGNEFTRQLDYFIECIQRGSAENVSSFAEAHQTDVIMQKIREDSAKTLTLEALCDEPADVILSSDQRTPFWKKLMRIAN